jgi:flagellin
MSDIVTGGSATLVAGKAGDASRILETAIDQVAVLRGRLGAFEKNTLETNMNSLNVALENVTASESSIRDADFAKETSNLTRAQILTQAGTSVLATANSTPQSVLSLLQ